MLFMVVVFMLAIGTQVYISGLEAQSYQASQQAQEILGRHAMESLSYTQPAAGLEVTDTGPDSVELVGMVLKFQNGTVYSLGSASSPAFVPSTIPSSAGVQVGPLVPSGTCEPGKASCASEYESIVDGASSGAAVGLVTSLGNTFWYVPGATGGGAGGPGAGYYHTASAESTTSSTFVGIPGLSFSGAAGAYYAVQVFVAYWQSSPSSTVIAFAVSVTSGASFLFCGGLYWADPAQGTTDLPAGNECTSASGTSLGPTDDTQNSCTSAAGACEFVGTAFVSFKDAGTFQFEFSGSSSDTANVAQDSTMVVTQAS